MVIRFNVIFIRSKHKQQDREAAVRAFNNKDNPIQILIMSLKICSTALNLQHDYSDVIFLDIPSSAQGALEAGARVVRIGQNRAYRYYIPTSDHSYDQVLQALAAQKMISIIGGYTGKTVGDDEIDAFKQQHPDQSPFFEDL